MQGEPQHDLDGGRGRDEQSQNSDETGRGAVQSGKHGSDVAIVSVEMRKREACKPPAALETTQGQIESNPIQMPLPGGGICGSLT